jgi:acetyl esterase/lipase
VANGVFNPQLTRARFLPRTTVLPWNLRIIRMLTSLSSRREPDGVEVVSLGDAVSIRLWRLPSSPPASPALLWIHGGGMVMGSAAQDDRQCCRLAHETGVMVGAVDYRLAPEYPFPTPLEDCYRALAWLAAQPDIDTTRLAVGGASAGGGLAAAVALLAQERGEFHLSAQILAYPMLDDRTTERTDIDGRRVRMWNQRSNRYGWNAYLGPHRRGAVPPLAAPARYDDLSGLPPAWIGVGTNDLFHDEDVAYANRLRGAGVPCELHEVPGAYHAFDLIESKAAISVAFTRSWTNFLRKALQGENPHDD